METLLIVPPVAAAGYSLVYLLAGGGFFGAFVIFVVAKMLSSNSAKGLTALAWKSGFSMRLSLQMQLRLARLPPKARLNPSTVGFPMTQKAMDWQIEFFRSLAEAN